MSTFLDKYSHEMVLRYNSFYSRIVKKTSICHKKMCNFENFS